MAAVDQVVHTFRRALTLDATAYEEIRDNPAYTPYSVAATGIAILLAAIGAFLWAETIADSVPDGWFFDTIILGTIFTAALMAAGLGVTYVVLTQFLRESIPTPDAFIRVAALGYVSYAVALLVFLPQIGFAFGLLAIAFVFFDTVFAIRSAYPAVSPWNATVAVVAGDVRLARTAADFLGLPGQQLRHRAVCVQSVRVGGGLGFRFRDCGAEADDMLEARRPPALLR